VGPAPATSGSFAAAACNGHGFFDQHGVFSRLDVPGAALTDGNGINA